MGYYKDKQIELFERLDKLRDIAVMADKNNLEIRDILWGYYSGNRSMLEKILGEDIEISEEGYHQIKERVILKSS